MTDRFQPIEPYAVDLTSDMLRGQIRRAAQAGDKRAQLTIRQWDKDHPLDLRPAPNLDGVARGRALYRAHHPKAED